MEKNINKYKTVKISLNDYIILNNLQCLFLTKRKLSVNKKNLLGWAVKKVYKDLTEVNKTN